MDPHEAVKIPSPGMEGAVRKLLRVDEKDLLLKSVFDYFRNYLVCAALLGGAMLLFQYPDFYPPVPFIQKSFALVAAMIAVVLLALNLFYGVVFASALGVRKWQGLALGLFLFVLMFQLVFAVGFNQGFGNRAQSASKSGAAQVQGK